MKSYLRLRTLLIAGSPRLNRNGRSACKMVKQCLLLAIRDLLRDYQLRKAGDLGMALFGTALASSIAWP